MSQNVPHSDALLHKAAAALFRLGRLFSRMELPGAAERPAARSVELSRILVVQAVEVLLAQGEQDVSVGVIAQQLAVEPSTASRLVSEAIKDGYLVRRVSPLDNRRVQLELTEAGGILANSARAYQVDIFRQVTRDWTASEREEFARLFIQFADAVSLSIQAQTIRTKGGEQSHT